MEQYIQTLPDFMVLVRCFTFNHSAYITDALNGFTIQQTNFPFVIVLVDDASTDGEQKVIQKYIEKNFKESTYQKETDYANVTFAQHVSNKNCYIAAYFLKENHYSQKRQKAPYVNPWRYKCKYEALCEGDDFWIDPMKLQKQADFLDANPDYGMVHTDFDLIKGRRHHEKFNVLMEHECNFITKGQEVGSLTVMFRLSVYNKLPHHNIGKGWPMGDVPLWIELAHEAKVHYIPQVTSKYRVLEESASHSSDIKRLLKFVDAGVEIKKFYANLYGIELENGGYDSRYYEIVVRYACRNNNLKVAKEYYKQAKTKKLLTCKCRLFYYSTIFPIIKKMLELYIKV